MDVNSADFWQAKYENNQFPWDLGGPTPVFQQLIRESWFVPGKMMVPGAGLGHDARLFAKAGFAVTAVDFAPEAVAAMHQFNASDTPVTVLQTDFFHLPEQHMGLYDYVLDYTAFCAIDPARRHPYAALIHRLLKPGGMLIMLAFPIGKRPGGPPYVVMPDQIIELFTKHWFNLYHRENHPHSVPERRRHEELLILTKVK